LSVILQAKALHR